MYDRFACITNTPQAISSANIIISVIISTDAYILDISCKFIWYGVWSIAS